MIGVGGAIMGVSMEPMVGFIHEIGLTGLLAIFYVHPLKEEKPLGGIYCCLVVDWIFFFL